MEASETPSKPQVENLESYLEGLLNGEASRALYHKHAAAFEGLEPIDVFRSFRNILDKGYNEEHVVEFVPRVILALQQSLPKLETQGEDNLPFYDKAFFQELRLEDKLLHQKLDAIRPLLKQKRTEFVRVTIAEGLKDLRSYKAHFSRLQNILFPALEKADYAFTALSILWTTHEHAISALELAITQFESDNVDEALENILIGKVFQLFASSGKKEEQFLYPSAKDYLTDEDIETLHEHALSYPCAFNLRLEQRSKDNTPVDYAILEDGIMTSKTGSLSAKMLSLIVRNLPLDFTVIDANDKVLYFSDTPDRVFPRSSTILGSEVINCHPPKSYDKVEEILKAFKSGKKDQARFWIDVCGKKILITYYALRDNGGNYQGVLETSQDITDIIGIEGEQRLAQWNE